MRELIEELKQANQLYLSERDLLEGKLKTEIAQVQKFATQCQINSKKAFMFEQVTADYRNALADLENDNSGATMLQDLRQRVQAREDELKLKFDEEASHILINAKIDPQFVTLREELQNQVKLKERMLEE